MSSLSVIIPAAGSGVRMKSKIPKPFIRLNHKTILEYTVEVFKKIEQINRIIIIASASNVDMVRSMFPANDPGPEIICVEGGAERYYSVYNGMKLVGEADLIAIHDAARPFVSRHDIMACCEKALKTGAAILAVQASDTVKISDEAGRIISTLDRDHVWLAQTPQIFKKEIIFEAYKQARKAGKTFTDEASLVEYAGFPVQIVPGDPRNFKLTYPQDIERAKTIIEEIWQK